VLHELPTKNLKKSPGSMRCETNACPFTSIAEDFVGFDIVIFLLASILQSVKRQIDKRRHWVQFPLRREKKTGKRKKEGKSQP
jgi:hypothetical protein